MGIFSWIVVGLLAGGLARMVTGAKKRGCIGTILVGVVGALIGGALFNAATGEEDRFTHFGLGAIGVAFVGACVLLIILQALSRDQRSARRR
jgi:uncharacterized membrane protein YeaQ/YmgE (transglycosylase-associated protein family)